MIALGVIAVFFLFLIMCAVFSIYGAVKTLNSILTELEPEGRKVDLNPPSVGSDDHSHW